MRPAINPDTTVGALLEAFPELEAALIDAAPAFAKLRNPVVRRTIAKVASLEQAAKIGGISLQELILKLRSAAGQSVPDPAVPNAGQASDGPSFCLSEHHVVEEIDADAMLERGVHPIGRIRDAVKALGPGEVVLLTSAFRPEPLIETLRRAGSTVHTSIQGARHFTYFARITVR